MVRAFRDTWNDGIHSYLSYLRDRLVVARDLLTDSGSIFVQIGDENVHVVRSVTLPEKPQEDWADENAIKLHGEWWAVSASIPPECPTQIT